MYKISHVNRQKKRYTNKYHFVLFKVIEKGEKIIPINLLSVPTLLQESGHNRVPGIYIILTKIL